MTQPSAPPDRGAVRSAVEALLRTCVDLERRAEAVAGESNARAQRVTGELARVRLPADVAALTQEIDRLGRELDTDLRGRLAEARQPYVTEIHALLALLAPMHGFAALPPAAPATPGAALSELFPAGFARSYVADLLTGVQGSSTLGRDLAASTAPPTAGDLDDALRATRSAFSDEHVDEGMRLVEDATCHALQRHGAHLPERAQLARLIWLKDPSGEYTWQVLASGSVATNHRCGPVAGGFTSPDAFVKPIEAFLERANNRGGTDEFLTRAVGEATRIGVHVSAEQAGLVPGDAAGYRGAGIGTKETRIDWSAARKHGLEQGHETVFAQAYDPIARGTDPGATLAFKKVGDVWHLVTCFPVDLPGPMNKRLEDLA